MAVYSSLPALQQYASDSVTAITSSGQISGRLLQLYVLCETDWPIYARSHCCHLSTNHIHHLPSVQNGDKCQRRYRIHGILPPRESTPPSPSPPPSPSLKEKLDQLSHDELKDLADDIDDDETERMVEQLRRQKLRELQSLQTAKFGRVYPIGREDYTREVTDASKVDSTEERSAGRGTGVVCFLYKDGVPRSERTFEHIRVLAQRHPHSKFVSIVGDKCIPNLPDTRVPMLIIYRNGEIVNQIVSWGADRERRIEELEAVLILAGAIVPQRGSYERKKNGDDSSDEEEDDDPSSRMRSAATSTNAKAPKNIRSSKDDKDDDSDFEFDM